MLLKRFCRPQKILDYVSSWRLKDLNRILHRKRAHDCQELIRLPSDVRDMWQDINDFWDDTVLAEDLCVRLEISGVLGETINGVNDALKQQDCSLVYCYEFLVSKGEIFCEPRDDVGNMCFNVLI
jgi:regulator of sigma D